MVEQVILLTSLLFSNARPSGLRYQAGATYHSSFLPTTHFNMRDYFKNLYSNQPLNEYGLCGFVSLCSVLSFADTFYNDDIISDLYEERTSALSTEQAILTSPGVKKPKITENYETPYLYAVNTYNVDYQSYIMYTYNMTKGNTTIDTFETSLAPGKEKDICQSILPGYLQPQVTEKGYGRTQQEYISFIKERIDEKIPVIVSIFKHDDVTGKDSSFHSAVAYDYDANGLYFNLGWGKGCAHYNYLSYAEGFKRILYCEAIDFSKVIHRHSDNYQVNGTAICGCNLNDEVVYYGGATGTTDPIKVKWMSYYSERNSNESFVIDFGLIKSDGYTDLFTFSTQDNFWDLSYTLWEYIRFNSDDGFYFTLKREENGQEFLPITTEFRGKILSRKSPSCFFFLCLLPARAVPLLSLLQSLFPIRILKIRFLAMR